MENTEAQTGVEFRKPEPVFKTRSYEILALSTRSEGINFQTGKILPRPPHMKQALLTQGEYGERILANIKKDLIEGEIPSSLKEAILEGNDQKQIEAQVSIWREVGVEITDEQIAAFIQTLPQRKSEEHSLLTGQDRSRYARKMEKNNKFRLSNVTVSADGTTLKADINKVPFVAYKHIRKPEDVDNGLIEFAYPTGVCNVLETTEAEGRAHNFFVLGRRYEENNQYRASRESGGQPGALGAGIMDSTFSRHTLPGHAEVLTDTKIFNAGNKELIEEAGFTQATQGLPLESISDEDIKDFATGKIHEEAGPRGGDIDRMKIVCFGRDLVAPHQEIGLTAVSPKSLQELIQVHKEMQVIDDEKNFSEGIFYIPATPEAVEKFVTQCRSLMPPTHYMPLIAAAYEKLATANGGGPESIRIADEWKKRVELGSDTLWKRVDSMVKEYYEDVPSAIEENKKECRRDSINEHGFDPVVLSDRQIMEKQNDGTYKPVTLDVELELLGFSQSM